MRVRYTYNHIINHLPEWMLVFAIVFSTLSCTDDYGNAPVATSDEATVILTIKTSKSDVSRAATRVQTDNEAYISNVNVLVFNDALSNGNYSFSYRASGTHIDFQDDQTTQFQATLHSSETPLKLYVIANADEVFQTYTPASGDSEASVKANLKKTFTTAGYTNDLPMYGEVSLPSLSSVSPTTVSLPALRAVARVDVVKDLETSSPEFTMKEVYIFRANNAIQVIPNALDTGEMRVSSPSVPTNAVALAGQVVKSNESGTNSLTEIYVPEANSFTSAEDQLLKATVIVVGGVFEGDTENSYYRIDFNSGLSAHPFGQILRNYHYTFTIKKVSSTGWSTPQEAADNKSSFVLVEVQQWEDFTTGIYFPEDHIGLSTRQVQVPFLPNYTQVVNVESSLSYQIQWLDQSGAPTGTAVSSENVALSNGFFTATIVRNSGESADISHIRIESSTYNKSDTEYSYTLRLTANDTSADIKVTKESPSRYSGRVFQVLSTGTDYGSLGTYASTVGVTLAMRNVLDNQFSPTSTYPFKIGGFFFWNINASSYTNSTTAATVAAFKKMLSNVDVLNLTYSNTTSTQVATMLINEWLVEKPHRVLIVHRDNSSSNVNVVALTAGNGDGSWGDIQGYSESVGYRTAGASDYGYNNATEVQDFFNGPFGTVAENIPLFTGDGTVGATLLPATSKQYVTPLIYNRNTGYTGYMLVGVNKKRGIVYSGDSQFFQGSSTLPMSASANTNGTLDSSVSNGKYHIDVLNANIWAWIVGRVIYGPQPSN